MTLISGLFAIHTLFRMIQKAIAELYQKGVNTINEHIKNIYTEGELLESATIRKNRIVQIEGNLIKWKKYKY